MLRITAVAAIAFILTATSAVSQIVIDDFTSATPQSAQPNSEVAATVLGGYRDVKSNSASNTATAGGGMFTCAGTANFQGCTVQYDGQDMDPVNFTAPGFAPVDLTAGGQDRIEIMTAVSAGACNFLIQFCDNQMPTPQCASASVGGIVDGSTYTFAYTDFASVNFTAITAVQFNLTPVSVPVDCSFGDLATMPVTLLEFTLE